MQGQEEEEGSPGCGWGGDVGDDEGADLSSSVVSWRGFEYAGGMGESRGKGESD